MSKWAEATKRYRKREERQKKPRERPVERIPSLEEFLESQEGKEALALLEASGQYITFAVDDSTSACVSAWVLTHEGLRISAGVGGMAAAYASSDDRKPTEHPCTPHDAVEAWTEPFGKGAGKFTDDIVPWLREELDKIAEAAP